MIVTKKNNGDDKRGSRAASNEPAITPRPTVLVCGNREVVPSGKTQPDGAHHFQALPRGAAGEKNQPTQGATIMANAISTMTDANGRKVPTCYVSKFDKMRDRKVRGIAKEAFRLRAALEKFVASAVNDLVEVSGLKETALGEKGNFAVSSFDGLLRCGIRQRYVMQFDARVVRARELMLEYVDSVLVKLNEREANSLHIIIDDSFKTTSSGSLSVPKVMALIRMEIDNPKWREAKSLLRQSIMPQKGRCYLQVEHRPTTQDEWKLLRLDAADCWPKSAPEEEEDVAK